MSTRITQQELESYLWGAAVLLRGLIDAGDYKQFIFPLLFYKRVADVWEEEYQAAVADTGGDLSYAKFSENHRFQIPDGAHWNDVRQTPKNVGAAIQHAMRAIESANPDMLDGIFGDAPWTNRERLPDETLKNLIEHFSTQTLSVASVPEDELGNAYEFLIKKFADDSGHTAAEFYTNRTVVHLMTQLLSPQPRESIYDPTCGTGGMLISALDEVKRSGGEYRTLKLYGQERNLITSSIARMNLFLHGVEDFAIIRGDTLADPRHIEGDRLRQFDVILANPPYSIKQWDREAWTQDKWGRNFFGTPPQGRADYAFQQHILASLTAKGRCAVLWPHGVLFRNEEQAMRAKMIEQDWVEAVIGLGPNLFYNSPMESCVVVCNRKKPAKRKGTYSDQKTHGLIVDYLGIFDDVAAALEFDDQSVKQVVSNIQELKDKLPEAIQKCLEFFTGVDRSQTGYEGLIAAQQCLPNNAVRDNFAAEYSLLGKIWEALSPDVVLGPFEKDYKWLSQVYQSVQPSGGHGKLVWHSLGAKTIELIHQNVHVDAVRDDLDTLVLDADLLEAVLSNPDPKSAKEIEIKLVRRMRKHAGNPKFKKLSERLDALKDRFESGQINSVEFLKQLLEIAKETLQAEKEVPPDEDEDRGKAALTDLFNEVKTSETPIMVERVVTDIDEIVRLVRFPGWQGTQSGEREVKKALRKALFKYKLHADEDLFEKAFTYVRQYY